MYSELHCPNLLFSLINYESEPPCCPVTPGLCLLMVVQDSRHPCSEFPPSLLLAPHTDTVLHIPCTYIPRNPCEESPRRELQGWTAYLDFIYFTLGTRFLTSSLVINIRVWGWTDQDLCLGFATPQCVTLSWSLYPMEPPLSQTIGTIPCPASWSCWENHRVNITT